MRGTVVPARDTAPAVRVLKFGGTSVGTTPQRLCAVATRVAEIYAAGHPVVVVVSARGATTDELLATAAQAAATPSARESDQLLATGEVASAALLAMALDDVGAPAISLTGAQAGIAAHGHHGDGRIAEVDCTRLWEVLRAGVVAVVAGFQGVDPTGDVVTLGRGGSDTTAVALAAALGASTCEIYTDVAGVHSADPRLVPDVLLLPVVDSTAMSEMAHAGARVLHARSVELAGRTGVDIHVRSAFTDRPGTTVRSADTGGDMLETARPVTGIAHDVDVARVVIRPGGPTGRGVELFTALAEASVTVDLVTRTGDRDIGYGWDFTIARSHVPALRAVVTRLGCEADIHEPVAKVSLVGAGLLSRPGTTTRVLAVLAAAGLDTFSVSTSQVRVSVTVAKTHCARAVRMLHREFLLDGRDTADDVVAV